MTDRCDLCQKHLAVLVELLNIAAIRVGLAERPSRGKLDRFVTFGDLEIHEHEPDPLGRVLVVYRNTTAPSYNRDVQDDVEVAEVHRSRSVNEVAGWIIKAVVSELIDTTLEDHAIFVAWRDSCKKG